MKEFQNMLRPERAEGETFDEYKNRRKLASAFIKKTRTRLFWDSYNQGTYFCRPNAVQHGQGVY